MQTQSDAPPLQLLVERLAYRVALDSDETTAILALPHRVRTLERGQFIVRERELATHSCLMLSGFSIRSKVLAAGNRQIVSIHMNGDFVDLHNSLLRVADHSVQMLTPGQVAVMRREDVLDLAFAMPCVGRALWLETLVDASIAREWIANVGRRDARTRVAHLLCEFAVRMRVAGVGDEAGYLLPMTQEQLADATGLTPVHMNRTLKGLEAEGLIHRPTARMIAIGHWRALAEVGDFDTNYLHLREADPALD